MLLNNVSFPCHGAVRSHSNRSSIHEFWISSRGDSPAHITCLRYAESSRACESLLAHNLSHALHCGISLRLGISQTLGDDHSDGIIGWLLLSPGLDAMRATSAGWDKELCSQPAPQRDARERLETARKLTCDDDENSPVPEHSQVLWRWPAMLLLAILVNGKRSLMLMVTN